MDHKLTRTMSGPINFSSPDRSQKSLGVGKQSSARITTTATNTPDFPHHRHSNAENASVQPPPRQSKDVTSNASIGMGKFYNQSSLAFSFCGDDAFVETDVIYKDPPPESQQAVAAQPESLSVHSNASSASGVEMQNLSDRQRSTGGGPQTMPLSVVNLEYFYNIPTPGAPIRAQQQPFTTSSNVSNNSGSHHHPHLAQQNNGSHYRKEHGTSGSFGSNHSASTGTGVQMWHEGRTTPSTTMPPAPLSPSMGSPNMPVQKDVLALMAAEQQQQKFVLQQRNVYISGLPLDFRPSAFRAMCEVFGRIESSKLCMEAEDSSRCRGFGFVLFLDVESATSCITSLNGKVMQGRTLQVRRADLSAAPQPLHPVTQRNRTGSGLVTSPSLPQIFGTNPNASLSGQQTALPPQQGGMPAAPGSSMMVSGLPFTFATPTMVVPPAVSTAANTMTQKTSFTAGSSFPYGGPSHSNSATASSTTPTVMYAQNPAMMSTVGGAMNVMQTFTAVPPGSAFMATQQQPQQLLSHPSLSRSETTTAHTTTPSSAASSIVNTAGGFAGAQQPQFQPQPPLHSPMQPPRPFAGAANVAYYQPFDAQTAGLQPGVISPPAPMAGAAAGVVPVPGMPAMYSTSTILPEYLTIPGGDPNASNSNIFYFIPQ